MILPRRPGTRHDGGMASEFRPGHPIVFWMAIMALVFALYSGAHAAVTYDRCDSVTHGHKHWQVWPPEWVCQR